VCLDGADLGWVTEAMAQGHMPTLAQLAASGALVPLSSDAHVLEDSSWASFATGLGPGEHGHYSTVSLLPGSYRLSRHEGYPHLQPFWDALAPANLSTTVFDLPRFGRRSSATVRTAFWTNPKDRLAEPEDDPVLRRRLRGAAPRCPSLPSMWTRRDERAEEQLLTRLESALARRVAATRLVLRERPADLFLTALSETHHAGHSLHPHTDPRAIGHDPARVGPRLDRLRRLHRAVDRALADILEATPPRTDIVVFSLHGIAERYDARGVLGELLRRLGFARHRRTEGEEGVWSRARAALPPWLRASLSAALPQTTQDRILAGLLEGSHDWSATRAFALDPSRGNEPWIRVNLRGREPHGVVDSSGAYETLCDEICQELLSVRSADSRLATASITRTHLAFPGPRAASLPDLVVTWSPPVGRWPLSHPRLGQLAEGESTVSTSGHSNQGFLVAAGPSIIPGAIVGGAHISDLAPTILHMLGVRPRGGIGGRALKELAVPATLDDRSPRPSTPGAPSAADA
jgi:predicted AlkP superfamily phosphohydrolase/phosphomutase